MAEPPVYLPPEEKKTAYPPPAGRYPQPAAYPQGQPVAYPQGQPVAYPQGQPVAYPQGQPVAYPQGQPGVVYPPGQQVVITQPNATHVYHTGNSQGCCNGSAIAEHYNPRAGLGTGILHLIVGALSIILGGAAFAFPVIQIGYGIWSAIILFIPTGILGVASKNRNACVVVAYMVMAILTSFHAIGMLAYEVVVAAVLSFYTSCYFQDRGIDISYVCEDYRSNGALTVHTMIALLGLIEFVNAIVSAAYCCRGHSCCCAPPPTNQGASTTTTIQYGQTQAQPMTVVANKYAPGPESEK